MFYNISPPVLVEDGLGVRFTLTKGNIFSKVLILVLVEDGLGEARKLSCAPNIIDVLILVLVEDGLGGQHVGCEKTSMCLS